MCKRMDFPMECRLADGEDLVSKSSHRRMEASNHVNILILVIEVWHIVFYIAFQDTTYPRPLGHIHKGHNY